MAQLLPAIYSTSCKYQLNRGQGGRHVTKNYTRINSSNKHARTKPWFLSRSFQDPRGKLTTLPKPHNWLAPLTTYSPYSHAKVSQPFFPRPFSSSGKFSACTPKSPLTLINGHQYSHFFSITLIAYVWAHIQHIDGHRYKWLKQPTQLV